MDKILVWDWPVRIGHWLLAGAFTLAWLTGESETWRLVHAYAGGTVVSVILFRLAWGMIGTNHARFSSFVRGPRTVFQYLAAFLRWSPPHATGHNPAGGWAIVGLLGLGLLAGASGWAVYQDIGGEWLEEAHEILATAMLMVVLLHLAGVIVGSLAHGENLVAAMFTGRKPGPQDEAIPGARLRVILVMLPVVAALAWWLAR